MEDNDYVLAFDHFYTTNHIQILKSLLPFMENGNFRMLPALIKYMEFQYTFPAESMPVALTVLPSLRPIPTQQKILNKFIKQFTNILLLMKNKVSARYFLP